MPLPLGNAKHLRSVNSTAWGLQGSSGFSPPEATCLLFPHGRDMCDVGPFGLGKPDFFFLLLAEKILSETLGKPRITVSTQLNFYSSFKALCPCQFLKPCSLVEFSNVSRLFLQAEKKIRVWVSATHLGGALVHFLLL